MALMRGEPMGRAKFEVRVGELKNGKETGKEEIIREMVKVRGSGWWIRSGGYIIYMLCLKTGDML